MQFAKGRIGFVTQLCYLVEVYMKAFVFLRTGELGKWKKDSWKKEYLTVGKKWLGELLKHWIVKARDKTGVCTKMSCL